MTTRILAVCTGNICRSPMAVAVLRSVAATVGFDAQVASAGTWEAGVEADPHAVKVMARRGLDLTPHRSHVLATADIDAAHLILAMATDHVVDIAARSPAAFRRTFTLKEFVARATAAGPRRPDETVAAYLERLNEGRSYSELLRMGRSVDIEDPLGQGRRAFERTAGEIERLATAAVEVLAGYEPGLGTPEP